MSIGTTLLTSFLVTLARPATWPLALSSFLVRGGLVLVLAPIVVVPSAVGVGNVVAPVLTSLALGITGAVVVVVAGAGIAILTWLLAAGAFGAAVESELTALVAQDEDLGLAGRPSPAPPGVRQVGRILSARLIAHLPTAIALLWGSARVAAVAYRELTVPSETATAVVVRVALGAPEVLLVVAVAWAWGEAIGSIAARRIVIAGASLAVALGTAVGAFARGPIRVSALYVVPTLALGALLVPVAWGAAAGWTAVRGALTTEGGEVEDLVILVVFVATWAGGLVLLGAATAWRAAVWTVDAAGTFGATDVHLESDWNRSSTSGTLGDSRPRGADPDSRS